MSVYAAALLNDPEREMPLECVTMPELKAMLQYRRHQDSMKAEKAAEQAKKKRRKSWIVPFSSLRFYWWFSFEYVCMYVSNATRATLIQIIQEIYYQNTILEQNLGFIVWFWVRKLQIMSQLPNLNLNLAVDS